MDEAFDFNVETSALTKEYIEGYPWVVYSERDTKPEMSWQHCFWSDRDGHTIFPTTMPWDKYLVSDVTLDLTVVIRARV
jgi:hypothetical protein